MIKPTALKKGDCVAVLSLSSGILGEDFCSHQLELGKKRLKSMGLKPVFMPNTLKGLDYLKNHPEARAQDLKDAFKDSTIKGIFCAIGGDDTYRIVPYLLEDKEFIRNVQKNPKLFTGFSDTTINHLLFYQLGMTSFYGPNFINDLAELADNLLPYTEDTIHSYFEGFEQKELVSSDYWYEERRDFSKQTIGTHRVQHLEKRGYEILQGTGSFSGTLLGGCLESLSDLLSSERYSDKGLINQQYSLYPSLEQWKDKILFLETSEEKPTPKQLEQLLLTLKRTGIFSVINGVLVGKPQDEQYYEEYKEIYKKIINHQSLPILYNVNFGHAYPRCALPYGIRATVEMVSKKIIFDESYFQSNTTNE
ncbi:Muramoyltetrapeptide carboxypeptidase LdcA (peptidoglycan recycling) [Carnobacterium iners]|uniref:Muramoyltetrapeptide carboxypeptidase LdcA (Peptidoglycan recycling) n=1 Tax=Carnobacterium iners TaxID=1073423 RepID=A0A1X7MQU0_9LACT|nr:S66 peptidase family protein [Carnobacterium iners]SEL22332.1 Muramoyltetrapeptide carboxypeptidase LdcA (peptidoglycan recycling) [Carnobacterium iners]SMH27055.1 Muramoyltetrapeptide carboxypeptidase LdcA (peptidoglycan recycling) [Carnobacterium iners]